MPDDLSKRGSQDRHLINVNEAWELQDWAMKFGVSQQMLKEAVLAVGTDARDVEIYLNRRTGQR